MKIDKTANFWGVAGYFKKVALILIVVKSFTNFIKIINPNRSLKARLGLTICAVALGLALLSSLAISSTASTELEKEVGSSLAQLAFQVTDKLERNMFERYREIQILTTLDVIKNATTPATSKRELLEKLQSTYPIYSWIGLTDNKGKVFVSTGGLLERQNVSSRPWFQKAQTQPYVGDVHEAKLLAKFLPPLPNGEPLRFLDVSAPVITSEGQLLGVLGAHLSWAWASEVEKLLLQPSQESSRVEILIFNTSGQALLAPTGLQDQKLPLTAMQTVEAKTNGYTIESWLARERYLTGFALGKGYLNYPGLGWTILIRQPLKEAFAPVQKLRQQILFQDLALGVMVALCGWSIADYLTRSLLKLAAAAEKIQLGAIDVKIPLIRGIGEVAKLSLSLRSLVQSLLDKEQELEISNQRLQIELKERQQSETRFRTLVEQSPLSIQIFTPDGIRQKANRAWEQLWGISLVDSLYDNIFNNEFLTEKGVMPYLQKAFAGEGITLPPMLYETNLTNSKGASCLDCPKWIRGLIYPVKDENGKIREVVLLQEDITEIKLAQEEIVQLNSQLEQRVIERTAQLEAANRELEAFSYSVSHDLRAPLRSIDGFSQALLEEYATHLDEMGQDYLQRVCKNTRRMGELIEDLLYLSRVTRGEICCEPTNLSAIALTIAQELLATNKERQVDFVIAPELVANADKKLMRIVLENLMGNAWKFTTKQLQTRIEFGRIESEDSHAYFVRDNGAGFDMAYANKLFGVFQRLHPTTEFEGTGIGLATVQRIIHRHGGRIWAQGEVSLGATFYFTL
ncbi:MAG: PAS domain S-box protein [Hydrococcus sp. RM1_1_31]|nr:PAS domain S-box protein [Hydrococcus sp. RM1_1_31]